MPVQTSPRRTPSAEKCAAKFLVFFVLFLVAFGLFLFVFGLFLAALGLFLVAFGLFQLFRRFPWAQASPSGQPNTEF